MKVAFHTLGCKVNSYETQAVLEQFKDMSFEVVDFDSFADVYIVNTCSVTKEASRKSRQILHRTKKINPKAITVALGCYAQEDKEALMKDSKVDIVIGNNEKSKTLELVMDIIHKNQDKGLKFKVTLVEDLTHCKTYESQEITNQGEHVRAYVKIQDGCNRFCSYCIIPYLRGRSRSRTKEDILSEVKTLANNGYKEIVLTGIDLSMYGQDLEEISADKAIVDLCKEIEEIEGIKRIRFGSLEVSLISEYFVSELSKLESICPHFHLSLQSGCDSVLQRMNRKYTANEYKQSVELLRKYFDNPAITTDIIVGFPEESEEEFNQTVNFAKEIKFAAIHVFPYSRRKGTKADNMKGQLTAGQKAKRVATLLEVAKQLQKEYVHSFEGKKVRVLVEEEVLSDEGKIQQGFTPHYIKVRLKNEESLINQMVEITLDEKNTLAFS